MSSLDLKTLPKEIGNLTNLRELDLGHNQLTALPKEIGNLKKLTKLYLGCNQLTALPKEIGNLTSLSELYLGNVTGENSCWISTNNNQLTKLPEEICNLRNLTILNLDKIKLTALSKEIGKLTNLTKLNFSGNKLTALPKEIGNLTKLTELYLYDNKLTEFPEEICNLRNLTILNLDKIKLTALSKEIGKLTNLTELNLSGNKMTALPKEIGNLTKLTELYLYDNKLTEFPEEICNMRNLTELNLGGNKLTALSKEIDNLTNLSWLDLGGNQLTALPEEIGNLTNLRGLVLRGNQLTALPKEICNLTKLTELNLRGNQLTVLPKEICYLTNLYWLALGGNQLTALPKEICNLTKLTELDLRDNQLTALSPKYRSIGIFSARSYHNQIQELFNYLKNFATVHVSVNGEVMVEDFGQTSLSIREQAFNSLVSINVDGETKTNTPSERDDQYKVISAESHDSIFYPVGQGLFYCGKIIQNNDDQGFFYVFDCGAQYRGKILSSQIRSCLKLNNKRIDLLVLSHLHWDHVSGIKELLSNAKVGRIVLPYLYPSERFYVASKSMSDPGFRDDPDHDWYQKFIAKPATFLKDLGVQNVSFIRGGDTQSREGRREEYRDLPRESPWSGSKLPARITQNIEREEDQAKTNDIVDVDNYFDSNSKAGKGHWLFSFFNCELEQDKFQKFQNDFRYICGDSALESLLGDTTSLKLIRHAYDGLFSENNLNKTSLAVCCRRLAAINPSHCMIFNNGISPSSYRGQPALYHTDHLFSPAFLLTGDLPVNQMWDIFAEKFGLRQTKQPVVPLVYQVPHHGSLESWNEAQRDTFENAVFILCARTMNHYGHPHPEVLRSIFEENRPAFWVTENRSFSHRLQITFH
jgi:Leucine-rich repeat (LRR) protein